MITALTDKQNIWAALAAPLDPADLSFRQDGKATPRDGGFVARFVAYWDWPTLWRRFQEVVPGEFDVTLERLDPGPAAEADTACAFKARIQVLGVIRENVGYGKDVKQAATDAMKRAASLGFGLGIDVYDSGPFFVKVDGDGRYAKPVEDVQAAYARKNAPGAARVASDERPMTAAPTHSPAPQNVVTGGAPSGEDVACPKCEGKMWDNRVGKRNPKAPDFKCRDRSCDGVIWPPKGDKKNGNGKQAVSIGAPVAGLDDFEDFPPDIDEGPVPF